MQYSKKDTVGDFDFDILKKGLSTTDILSSPFRNDGICSKCSIRQIDSLNSQGTITLGKELILL